MKTKKRIQLQKKRRKRTKNNYFTKDVLWEKFQSDAESQLFSSSENLFIEFKDVSTNERVKSATK